MFVYGRVNQATLILRSLTKVLKIYFADSSLNSLSGASNQYDLWVFDDFQSTKEEGGDYVNNLCQVLDGEESFSGKGKGLNQLNKQKRVPVVLLDHSLYPLIPKVRIPYVVQSFSWFVE